MNTHDIYAILKERVINFATQSKNSSTYFKEDIEPHINRIQSAIDALAESCDIKLDVPREMQWKLRVTKFEKIIVLKSRTALLENKLESPDTIALALVDISSILHNIAIDMGVRMSQEDETKEATNGRR